MAAHDRIFCSKCRGENDRGTRFCWYCGAPLRGGAGRSRAQQVGIDVATRASKWLLFLGLLAGLVAGAYYALDHYVWPAVGSETSLVQAVTSTTSRPVTTTTTTLPPRSDRSITAGADRYATAIAITRQAFPNGAPALVLVPGEDYAQSLAVAPLAAAYGAAVLLWPSEGLRDDLAQEIERLAPSQIFLVAISRPKTVTGLIEGILDAPTVTRLTGADEYETAALVAEAVKAKVGTVSKVVIVPSESFVEALAVAPLAAANGWPILLSPAGGLPRSTRDAITSLGATSALVVGLGTEVVPDGVALDQVESQVGTDQYDTAALVVRYAVTHGSSFTHTAIVTGDSFPDALVMASYLALDKGVLILVKDGEPPAPLLSVLNANLGDVRTLDFVALPELARRMAAERSMSSSTKNTTGGTTTTLAASGGLTPNTSGTTPDGGTESTTRPSSGGW